jgi:DNA-binding beta-propeller fold protein YncE
MPPRRRCVAAIFALATVLAAALPSGASAQGRATYRFARKQLAGGLKAPHGVAVQPKSGDVYFSEREAGTISMIHGNGSPVAVISDDSFRVDVTDLPKWAITANATEESWASARLRKPGPVAVGDDGTIYVAEQLPEGRILSFSPDAGGNYPVAKPVPVPWLRQEFQWFDLAVDSLGRFFVTGMDMVGNEALRFGSALMRDIDGDWWVMDFGPFAQFSSIVLSARQNIAILGDAKSGTLAWWEINRHIMVGGSPDTAGNGAFQGVSIYPDGSFLLAVSDSPNVSVLRRFDPYSGAQTTCTEAFREITGIAIDRDNVRYLVTDAAAGILYELTPEQSGVRFDEPIMRQIARSAEGAGGFADYAEAPAFMNNFFERLQSVAQDLIPSSDSTHSTQFTLGDIAGKLPIIAGRIRTVQNIEGIEDDPIETMEFFLLFPSKMVITDKVVTPSVSFFYAVRKSGKVEQTHPVLKGKVKVLRLSGGKTSTVGHAESGLMVPVIACGMGERDNGIAINLSFQGMGIYKDYYVSLFQSGPEQSARIVVKDPLSKAGYVTYEATFMQEMDVEGMEGQAVTREEISNLLVSGFGGGGVSSVGWLRLGKYAASMLVGFGSEQDDSATIGASGALKDVLAMKDMELRQEVASEVSIFDPNYVAPVQEDEEEFDPFPEAGGAPAAETAGGEE